MNSNKFCSDCPAYWEHGYHEWCIYKGKPTRSYHAACKAMSMLVEYSKAASYVAINDDGKHLYPIEGKQSNME